MGKINLLEQMRLAAWSGEVMLLKGRLELVEELQDILYQSLEEQIIRDITDRGFLFYAPEHDSWKDALIGQGKADKADYSTILERFTEEELQLLWECSHIADPVTEKDRLDMLHTALRLARGYESMLDSGYLQGEHIQMMRQAKAILTGIYNSTEKEIRGRQ